MKDVIQLIEITENLIFDFDIKTAMNMVSKLIEDLIFISNKLSEGRLNKLMYIMNLMNTSLLNKDYLLFNDILEYDLRPFLELEGNL